MGLSSTKASSQRLASMKDCSKVLPPSTKRDWRLRSYRTCMIWGNISCPKFIGRYSTPGRELWGCSVNTSVGTLPSNKWSVGDRLSLRSMTRRTGERPYQLRTLREGLSSSAVRVPTSMAACSARFLCTIMEVNGVDRMTGLPPFLCKSMKPSADSAHFRVIYGRRKVWKVMKRLMRCRHSFSNTPTVTSRPASFNFCIPRPATLEKGSWQPITMRGICFSIIKSAQGGVFP